MLKIKRFANHSKLGCPGKLYFDDKLIAYTMEPPWIPMSDSAGGTPFRSCVPVGEYKIAPYHSRKYGDVYLMINPLLGVYAYADDRAMIDQRYKCIFVHRGNYHTNFQGCVGAGGSYLLMEDGMGITNTRRTCAEVLELVRDNGISDLIIEWENSSDE